MPLSLTCASFFTDAWHVLAAGMVASLADSDDSVLAYSMGWQYTQVELPTVAYLTIFNDGGYGLLDRIRLERLATLTVSNSCHQASLSSLSAVSKLMPGCSSWQLNLTHLTQLGVTDDGCQGLEAAHDIRQSRSFRPAVQTR